MFKKHIAQELSAYYHGELASEESRRVAEHLMACERCRREYEEIKLGAQLAERLPQVTAPAALWSEIETLLDAEAQRQPASAEAPAPGSVRSLPASRAARRRHALARLFTWPRLSPRLVSVSVALIFVFAVGVMWFVVRPSHTAWEVAALAGMPVIGDSPINRRGRIAVGEWLETDESSRAQIRVANIGQVEVDPNSRVRLVETRMTEHRLELARGRMQAMIWAPPRLFFVNTPSAVAVDYGCAYTLEVDDAGASLLHVTAGWVALELGGRSSMVPAGGACATRPDLGPGTPYFTDASAELRAALTRFDFEQGGAPALNTILAEARGRDTLTLWHLLPRVGAEERARVFDRMLALVPLPEGVTREGILNLDQGMLDRWRDELRPVWLRQSMPRLREAWRQTMDYLGK